MIFNIDFFVIFYVSLFLDKVPCKVVDEKSLFFYHDSRVYVWLILKKLQSFCKDCEKIET